MSDLQFLSFKFSNVFVPAETVILGCSLVFCPELPKMSILFELLTSDDVQNDASDIVQFLLKYKEIVQTRSKSWFFGLFWSDFFVHGLLHSMSYTPTFWQMEDLIKIYISVVSFINIAFVVVKVKIFKVFRIDSAAMKWSLFGGFSALLPQILFGLAEILTRGSLPERQNQCLKNPSKFWILGQMQCTQR